MSEWQPGDVATYLGEVVFLTDDREWIWVSTGRPALVQGRVNNAARRLAVIDPDDLLAVADLWKRFSMGVLGDRDGVTEMQAALREFANPTPPKPTVTPEMVAAMRQQVQWDREQSGYWQERERDHRGLSAVDAWLDSLADHLGVTE